MDQLLAFVAHKYNCDSNQPMWHQGPCDCGLYALFDRLDPIDIERIAAIKPDYIKDWKKSRGVRWLHERG